MKILLIALAYIFSPMISLAQNNNNAFTEREVHFYSSQQLKLAGILSVPASAPGEKEVKHPGIVLCHGPGGYGFADLLKKDTIMPAVSSWLCKEGYVVLRFCYRGVGNSDGAANRLIPLEQVEDIGNAITFLAEQPEVDRNRIGLFGTATGGANVMYRAGIDPRVTCVVSVNGMGDLGRWIRGTRPYWQWLEFKEMIERDRAQRVLTGNSRLVEMNDISVADPESSKKREEMEQKFPAMKKASMLTLESADALITFQPETVVERISPRAAMWICAETDTLVPHDEQYYMYRKAGEPKRLVVIEGETHHSLYFGKGLEKMMTHATQWFNDYLKKQ
jgi:hypothetical protein